MQIDLEQMFMFRDCSYKYDLQQKSSFKILNEHKAWATCSHHHKTFYDLFRDTDFLMDAIQSQVSCAEIQMDVSSMLSNKILKKGNKLVVFAGPRETKGIFVIDLFAHHASDSEDVNYSPSFNGWLWPSIPSLAFHYEEKMAHMFDILVSQPHTRPIQNLLIDGLRDTWNSADHGIIIGSQDFGSVGANPSSGYDPVGALKKIMKELEISDNDVTVVLSYRSPLVDHWNDLWRNHFIADNYKEFLCSEVENKKRWEFLDTHMDPLKVASEYRKHGWNVAIIDEEGAMSHGKDVAHVLACNVMQSVKCKDEWVVGLENQVIEPFPVTDLGYLGLSEKLLLEQYFRARDCSFKESFLQDDKITVLHQKSLWDTCLSESDQEKFKQLQDIDFLLDLLRSQQGCSNGSSADFSSSLVGEGTSAGDDNTYVVVTVVFMLLFILLVVVGVVRCSLRSRKEKKIRKQYEDPSDGVFVNDPKMKNIQTLFKDDDEEEQHQQESYEDVRPPAPPKEAFTPPRSKAPPTVAFTPPPPPSNDNESKDLIDDLGLGQEPKGSFQSIEFDTSNDEDDKDGGVFIT
jgi:hypothetical protein